MSSGCLRKRLTIVVFVLTALVGIVLWGRALLPADMAAQDSAPQVIATIPLGPWEEVWIADDVAVDPQRNRIYIVSTKYDAEKVFIIDGSTNTVSDTIVPDDYIFGMGVNPTTNRV